jgi:hypothetical protein
MTSLKTMMVLVTIGTMSSVARAQDGASAQRPLAHIAHHGLSFSLSIDSTNPNKLNLVVSERADSPGQPLALQWRFVFATRRGRTGNSRRQLGLAAAGIRIGTINVMPRAL